MLTRAFVPCPQDITMKTILTTVISTALVLATAAPAFAQQQRQAQQPRAVERKVLAERVCRDGATTTVAVSGKLIMIEYFSAPRADGTVAGYEDAYDFREAAEAKAQFNALRCPESG